MAICSNCGAEVQGRFCARCGTPASAGTNEPPRPEPYNAQSHYTPPPPGAQPYSAQTGGLSDNMAAALTYTLTVITGILFLVLQPYSRNRFVRFHAFQSIFLFGAWMAFWILFGIVTMVMPSMVTALLSLLSILVWLGFVAIWVVLMVKAYNGEWFKLPVIGDMAEKQA